MNLALKKGYRFISFEDERPADTERIIYLRHDVDLFPHMAQELAAINHSLGIRGTFFIQLSAKFYNLFDPDVQSNIRTILDLDQNIGLHYPSPKMIPDDPAVLAGMIRAGIDAMPNGIHGFQRFTTEALITGITVFCFEIIAYGFFHSRLQDSSEPA